jgi:ketosteroid isomerase-like protein
LEVSIVSTEENARKVTELHIALNSRDLDKAMELFSDDASWIVMPGGTCYAKEDIRKYLTKLLKTYDKFVLKDIHPPVVSGNTVTHEHTIEVRRRGRESFVPAVVVIEFGNGKISQVRAYIDKLEAAKQMASGVLAKRAVAAVAKQVGDLINP